MDKSSTLDCYLYYMWNVWSEEECNKIIEYWRAVHVWSKWIDHCTDKGALAAAATFYAEIDPGVRRMIVERAIKYYNE